MLLSIGRRERTGDLVDLLLECHERIRKFTRFAQELAARDAPPDEVREVAGQIRRYFAESLPLHVADEHEQLAPRLAGHSIDVDNALATMELQHEEHAPSLRLLITICEELVRDPGQRAALSVDLAAVASDLAEQFRIHLECEERVLFPVLRRLPTEQQAAILGAMRERRDRAMSA